MKQIKNVIYIHSHDSGKYLSVYDKSVSTPALDAFAKDALIFDNAFCASPTCSPSRAALLTGRYPHSNGMIGLTNRGFRLADYNQHLVRQLNSRGYETVLCGIQHEHGRYVNHEAGAVAIGYHLNLTTNNEGLSEEELVNWDLSNAQAVADWLEVRDSEDPFFLSFGLFSTHREYPSNALTGTAEPSSADVVVPDFLFDVTEVREDLAAHQKSLTYYNAALEKVLTALKSNGFFDDSIIFITSDHGIAFPQAKCTLRDAGIGIPLLMHVPGSPMTGQRTASLISQVDILPTLFDLLGFEIPSYCQGISQARLFIDANAEIRQEVFAEINFHTSYEPARCIRTSRYKYIRYFDEEYDAYNLSNMDRSESKDFYIESGFYSGEKVFEQLFDLYDDPYELQNLIDDSSYLNVLNALRGRLQVWMEETEDPLLAGPIPFQEEWRVNKPTALDPKSKDPEDFI